jgi:hypothetical protein
MQDEIHYVSGCHECPFRQIESKKMLLDFCNIDTDIIINLDYKIQPDCPLKTKSVQITLKQ